MKTINKVTVVTVCLNCIDTIELTLKNVQQQFFTNIEHVVIDGGSSDGTIEIIKSYPVDHFISEPDDGIYHAMDKGVAAATGDALIFLNAGDGFYDRMACADVVSFFKLTQSDIIFGDFIPYQVNSGDDYDHGCFHPGRICRLNSVTNRLCLKERNIHHQAIFYSRKIFDTCSFFSPEWPQGSDYELNVQALVKHEYRAKYINRVVTQFALGGVSTSNFEKEKAQYELLKTMITAKYFSRPIICDNNEYVYNKNASLRARISGLTKRIPLLLSLKNSYGRFLEKFTSN